MNVLVEWADGLPASTYEGIGRVEFIGTGWDRPLPVPNGDTLYLSPAAVRSVRTAPNGTQAGEEARTGTLTTA